MKNVGKINLFKFDSFSEMIGWLREDWKNRRVIFDGDNELAVFLSWNKETKQHEISGSNSDTFHIVEHSYDSDPETYSLEEYFGSNGKPLNKKFAKDYDLTKFEGHEMVTND